MSELHRPAMAILASGSGSTAEAFIHATQDGRVAADVGLVVCNNPPEKAGIYDRVNDLNQQYDLNIKTSYISKQDYPVASGESWQRGQSLAESEAIRQLVDSLDISYVGLMGYILVVRGAMLEDGITIFNTHPGILPETADTYGSEASQRVLDLGLPASAHTVHLVDGGVDTGRILCSTPVPVEPGDTKDSIFGRVQLVEKAVLPLVVDQLIKEKAA